MASKSWQEFCEAGKHSLDYRVSCLYVEVAAQLEKDLSNGKNFDTGCLPFLEAFEDIQIEAKGNEIFITVNLSNDFYDLFYECKGGDELDDIDMEDIIEYCVANEIYPPYQTIHGRVKRSATLEDILEVANTMKESGYTLLEKKDANFIRNVLQPMVNARLENY